MRTLLKLAVGAAIAGALVTFVQRQMNQRRVGSGRNEGLPQPYADDPPRGSEGFTLAEIAANHTGGSEGRSDGDEPMRTAGEGEAGERALNS
jgi:hypothetical protein